MALQTRVWAGGAGPALPANLLGANAATEISNAIGKITAGNMFGQVGGIPGLGNIFNWRVDRQNAPVGFINVSVQRNGVGAPSTIASVFVPDVYNSAVPGPQLGAAALAQYNARSRDLERAVRRGLEQSFATYALPAGAPQMLGGAVNNARTISRFEVHGVFSS
jgi:hypothetical protein